MLTRLKSPKAMMKNPSGGSVLSIIHSQDIGTYTLAYGNPKQYGAYWRPDSLEPLLLKLQLLRAELDEQGARTPSGAPQNQASPAPRNQFSHGLLDTSIGEQADPPPPPQTPPPPHCPSFTECGNLAQPLTSCRLVPIRLSLYGPRYQRQEYGNHSARCDLD
ncbi:hypothetical protein MJT46_016217 [Ovis ammon polii x Ovis aries]|nr:hypothetical protein MJT46_016217 [Ovis ammon polii x Ovis aries]